MSQRDVLILFWGEPQETATEILRAIGPSWESGGSGHRPFEPHPSTKGWDLRWTVNGWPAWLNLQPGGQPDGNIPHAQEMAGTASQYPDSTLRLAVHGRYNERESIDDELTFVRLGPEFGRGKKIDKQGVMDFSKNNSGGKSFDRIVFFTAIDIDPAGLSSKDQAREAEREEFDVAAEEVGKCAISLMQDGIGVRVAIALTGFERELANVRGTHGRSPRDFVRNRDYVRGAIKRTIARRRSLGDLARNYEGSRGPGVPPMAFSFVLPCGVHPHGWLNYDSHNHFTRPAGQAGGKDASRYDGVVPYYCADPIVTALVDRITPYQLTSAFLVQHSASPRRNSVQRLRRLLRVG